MCDWAIGTDTAGSLRIPASLCGVVSIKPTYGMVATEGVIPLSKSLDTVGPMAQDVARAASALALMTDAELRPFRAEPPPVRGMRLARASDEWALSLDEPTAAAWAAVGAGFPEVAIPDRLHATNVCTTISMYEASRFHRRWVQQHPERYGDEGVRQRLLDGLGISDEEYKEALALKPAVTASFEEAMSGWDAILVPATAMVAQPIDGPDVREPMTRFTRAFALTGQPVVTIPAPTTGLPVGIQVVGRVNDDATAVRAALALEEEWR
jgi:aspartyl-tRNA(Asn)/glutamyl-tRNA(Gln) amidotransferase subunit A